MVVDSGENAMAISDVNILGPIWHKVSVNIVSLWAIIIATWQWKIASILAARKGGSITLVYQNTVVIMRSQEIECGGAC